MEDRIRRQGGFTIMETAVTTAIVGVVAAGALSLFTSGTSVDSDSQLAKEVQNLNRAIDLYKAFGGNLDGAETPQEVLRRLQTEADAVSREQIAGLTGSLIDRRMRVHLLSEAAVESERERALWNTHQDKFFVANETQELGEVAVAAFKVDTSPENAYVQVNGSSEQGAENQTTTAVQEETRDPSLMLAVGNGWIWDYNETSTTGSSGPTSIALAGDSDGGGFGGVIDPEEESGGNGGDPAQQLAAPVFSLLSGNYLITSFDLELTLSNPNPGGVSRIIYHVSGQPWKVYGGETITVHPQATVTAFAESVASSWSNSQTADETYAVGNVQLVEPVIETSDEDFGEIEIESD